MKFSIGETVRLASGGPVMTVECVVADGVCVVWFEDAKALFSRRDKFPESALVRAPSASDQ